jgi:hypothetical protein
LRLRAKGPVWCAAIPPPLHCQSAHVPDRRSHQSEPEALRLAIQRFRRVQQRMREEVCAENNQHLFDYGIPVANKPDF